MLEVAYLVELHMWSKLLENRASKCAIFLMLVWQNILVLSMTTTKGTIIGGGRIGRLLFELNGKKDQLLTRGTSDRINADDSGPIYVCTRNDDLSDIIDKTPEQRRSDLVFLQNGILEDFLVTKGLEKNTQGLIYFAVSKVGESPIDGVTDTNPEGLTAACGVWASDFALRLESGNLTCSVLNERDFNIAMLEKQIWICAFMAVGSKYKDCTVGEVANNHNAEVRAIISELAASAAYETGVIFPAALDDRLIAYARSVAHFPAVLKEFEWRNGWFASISLKRAQRMLPDLSPNHSAVLRKNNLF